ncbi:MAG: transporter substrate-binding domain-containing protein, partial [Rhodococcus sp. (in: high G+C Gram-positive bacteria)]
MAHTVLNNFSTRRIVTVIGGAALVAASFTACTSTTPADGEDRLQSLRDAGTITVGVAGEAPYSFEENGELTGATIALHKRIFGNLGIDTVEGVNADFGALIPGLQANRFDVVSAGMSILPQRCEQAAFGDPEFNYTT